MSAAWSQKLRVTRCPVSPNRANFEIVEHDEKVLVQSWVGMLGYLADGSEALAFDIYGSWDACDREYHFGLEAVEGDSFNNCYAFLSPSETPVTVAKWAPTGTEYAKNPITWIG